MARAPARQWLLRAALVGGRWLLVLGLPIVRGRGFVRNALLRAYFWGIGLETLRYRERGDHLHVSLPSD